MPEAERAAGEPGAGIVPDGVLAGMGGIGAWTAGVVVEEDRAAGAVSVGVLTASGVVEEARATGTLAVTAGTLVDTTVFGGSVVVPGTVRVEAGVKDACGCTGGAVIEGGGTES
ncbi:MAG TPA: hypothetical protein VK550_34515, partial [Polyangiaceae bacterium]|nr:hypothetical protein [Polyangiaceae bacterium]